MLNGKNIVITGCNRGIGLAIMEKVAEYGGNVIACMRKASADIDVIMQDLQEKYGIRISPFYFDMSDMEAIKKSAGQILKLKVPVDGLVNNAGITGENLSFPMTDMGKLQDIYQINLMGPLYFTQRILKNMMRHRTGSIVNMSSMAAIDGEPGQISYVSSKSAWIGVTKKLASELGAKTNIRVNAVAPGITDTGMIAQMDPELLKNTLNRTALKRIAKPEEIAEVVAFLLSDRSSFVTGQVIRADGGAY